MTDYDAGVEKARRTTQITITELVDTKIIPHWTDKALMNGTFITEALNLIAKLDREIEELRGEG